MNDVLRVLLVLIVLLGAYRQYCQFRFYLARRRTREPFRGVVLRFPTRS